MDRKKKIILSVTGIFLVLLILVGLTYAYFLTQIRGNTNNKNISVTTANLALEYGDGNGLITGTNIIPGTTLTTKTFIVENNGNISVEYGVYLEELINEFERTSDLELTVTCESSVTSPSQKTCDGYDGVMLTENGQLVTNTIDVGETQLYRLTLNYVETNTDQSVDMKKRVEAKVQIYGLADTVDLNGTITDANNGDYVIVNSTPKRSEIIDGQFKVVGLMPGIHTINVYNSSDTLRYSKEITISKGTSESISGTTATVIDDTRLIKTTLSSVSLTITELKNDSPFSSGTLAYAIYMNAKTSANGTTFRTTPLTTPAEGTSAYRTGNYVTETVSTNSLCYEYYTWWVADTEEGASSGSEVSSYSEAVGKYVYDYCDNWTKYLESYDSTSDTLTFRVPEYMSEKTLSITSDDLGDSYYYRGAVEDNYVNFAGMCWRVVRIEGDGSIKLILEDQDQTCASSNGNWNIPTTTGGSNYYGNFGYNSNYTINYLNGETDSANSMATAFKNFQTGILTTNIASNYNNATLNDYLKSGNWCYDDKAYTTSTGGTEILDKTPYYTNNTDFYYDSYVRLYGKSPKETTLRCNGTVMNKFGDNVTDMYVATLTADEIAYADTYLVNNYQKTNSLSWWSLSPSYYSWQDLAYTCHEEGGIESMGYIDLSLYFRPSVLLKTDTTILTGDGTKSNPYVIN